MKDISRNIARGLFYLVAIVLLVWTSSLTVSFVANALPGVMWFVPYLALIIFDAGMIAWLFVFLRHAEGAGQRAMAIVACGLDFIGVGLMVIAEILLGGQTLTAVPENLGTWAIWGIGVWTVLNVLAVLIFHLADPEAQKQMSIQNEKDAIWKGALENLAKRRSENSAMLTAQLGARMYQDLLAELMVDRDGNGVPDVIEGNRQSLPAGDNVVEHQPERPPTPPAETRPHRTYQHPDGSTHTVDHYGNEVPDEQPPSRNENGRERVYRDENGQERDFR